MRRKKTILAAGLLLLAVVCAIVLVQRSKTRATLGYWQDQAGEVHVGMLRSDVAKILPLQNFETIRWHLEDWRMRHAPSLPPFEKRLKYILVHSDNDNLLGYEVADGISVILRYDMAGYVSAVPGVQQPGDHVTFGPLVQESPTGMAFDTWVEMQARQHFGH